jgi:hypothetical protein
MFGATPLVVIPFVETAHDRRVRFIKNTSVVGGFILSIALVFISI